MRLDEELLDAVNQHAEATHTTRTTLVQDLLVALIEGRLAVAASEDVWPHSLPSGFLLGTHPGYPIGVAK